MKRGPEGSLLDWLRWFVVAEFYEACKDHPKKTKNLFCLDCKHAYCSSCMISHKSHRTITVYKASNQVSVRIKDITPLWDTSYICDYSINMKPIFFLHQKLQQNGQPSSTTPAARTRTDSHCEICQYKLVQQACKYCSIQCKVIALEGNDGTSCTTTNRNPAKASRMNLSSQKMPPSPESSDESPSETSMLPIRSFRKRPRKGTSHRAPFF